MPDYRLCGCRVTSDVVLPELVSWDGAEDRVAPIVFRIGAFDDLVDPDFDDGTIRAKAPSELVISIPDVGRVSIRHGTEMVFDPVPGLNEIRLRANLIGLLQAILWLQRGLLPLHASTVCVDGRGIAISGPSGSGKSVMAAALERLGSPILADDITVIDASEQPRVLPGYQKLRIWDEVCEAWGLRHRIVAKAVLAGEKFVLSPHLDLIEHPVPLTDMIILDRGEHERPPEPLGGREAFHALLATAHLLTAARALGRHGQVFEGVAAMLAAGVRIWRVTVVGDLNGVVRAATGILHLLADEHRPPLAASAR